MDIAKTLDNYYKFGIQINDYELRINLLESRYEQMCLDEDIEIGEGQSMEEIERKIKKLKREKQELEFIKNRIDNAIGMLDERHQLFFVERYVEKRTHLEISHRMYVDPQTCYRWRKDIIELLDDVFKDNI